jgi:ABC-type antimicrobial peptide transport system permease subunit
MVLRKGAESELTSLFTRTQYQDLKFKPGIAGGRDGQPLVSLEVITVVNLGNADVASANVTVRGLLPAGVEMRHVRMASGSWFKPGLRQVVVGKSVADGYSEARLGKKIHIGRSDWLIVGVFDAGRSAQDSEIWGDVNEMAADLSRPEILSSALIQASDAVAAQALVNDINGDRKLELHAESEKEYYDLQTQQAVPIEYTGIFVAIIMAVGSAFAAMNTMYAMVARRAREIGTLRVLGFSRFSILTSFFVEAVLLSALGGVLGCLLVMPLNGLTTAIGNSNFAELAFDFRVTPRIMLIGIAFAVTLGSVGGVFPAFSAARKEILTALREA